MTYETSITAATGVTDPADVAAILDEMYNEHHTLNGLSSARFNRSARDAWTFVRYLRSDEGVAEMARYQIEMTKAYA